MANTVEPTNEEFRTLSAMQRRWSGVGRKYPFKAHDRSEWKRWRQKLIERLKELTGYDTMRSASLRPRITEEVDAGDHIRQRVEIQVEPGVVMPLFVLIPKNAQPPFDAVLTPHGHASGGKLAVAGIRGDADVERVIGIFNYDYGVQFARAGMIAFCPDARGFGERREQFTCENGNILASSCEIINHMAISLGQTVTGMWAWDLHRLVDYVQTRNDVRPGAIASAGLSGGALQTIWAAALDERIRCAVVSGYFYGYKASLLDMAWNCSCNYIPHLWENIDMGDLGALIAPRPMLIETGSRDPLNGAPGLTNVTSQLKITRKAYKLLGASDSLKHVVIDGEHIWGGVEAIPWLKQRLSEVEG